MIEDVIIHLTADNTVKLETIYQDHTRSSKTITFDELVELLKSSRTSDSVTKYMDTGVLPNNDATGIKTIATRLFEGGKSMVVLYRKPQPSTITYHDTVFNEVGLPGLVFGITYTGRQVRALYIAAVTDEFLVKDTPMYHYPLSNVAHSNTRVCFGRNNIFEIDYQEVADLHSVPNMFLSMPNNDDSYGDSNLSKLQQRELLEALQGKQFDSNWLKPLRKGNMACQITLREWIEFISDY